MLMKKLLLWITASFLIVAANAQLNGKRTEVNDARDRYADTTLPEGTALKDGKVKLKNGYRTVYLDSSRAMVVQKSNDENTGAFRCRCAAFDKGNYKVIFSGNEIRCAGGCSMEIALNPGKNVAVMLDAAKWKEWRLPAAANTVQRTKTLIRE